MTDDYAIWFRWPLATLSMFATMNDDKLLAYVVAGWATAIAGGAAVDQTVVQSMVRSYVLDALE